jgi:sugar/nucleoside kinase (ribokinase family)
MKKLRLTCIGDLMLDVVVRAAADVETGTDTPGSVRFRLGGSAGNTCRIFAGLGGRADLVCAAGDDGLGKRLIAAHRAAGVKVHAVPTPGLTPRLLALVAPGGERTFVTERGVADSVTRAAIKPAWLARSDALHVPAYSLLAQPLAGASLRAIEMARAAGALVSVDLASRAPLVTAGADIVLETLRRASPDILFANLDEVRAVAGRGGASRLLTCAGLVVVKLGASGCHLVWHNASRDSVVQIEVATKPIRATDTTGAGDAFAAGFLYSLLVSDYDRAAPSAALLRRAALAAHRSAARLIASPRPEIAL